MDNNEQLCDRLINSSHLIVLNNNYFRIFWLKIILFLRMLSVILVLPQYKSLKNDWSLNVECIKHKPQLNSMNDKGSYWLVKTSELKIMGSHRIVEDTVPRNAYWRKFVPKVNVGLGIQESYNELIEIRLQLVWGYSTIKSIFH